VFVTDKNGRAVPGLTAADFEVEDGGKRTSVAAFQAVDAGSSAGGAAGASRVVEGAGRRQFLMLFDMGFSTPVGLNKSRKAALDFLKQGIGPRDLVAVAVLGGGEPRVLVGFTSDTAQLQEAVASLGMTKGERLRDPLGLAWDLGVEVQETTGGLQVVADPGPDPEVTRDMFYLRQRADQEAYRRLVVGHVGGLDALAKLLNSVQGRKQVVLFSAGFDQSVVGGAVGAARQASNEAVTEGRLWEVTTEGHFGDASARLGLDQLFRDLGASDTVIHTVDVGGLAGGGDVSEATRTELGRGRDSLAELAAGSGGMFVKEVNDVSAALHQVVEASRYFYVLGFAPRESTKPGRLHKLAVKVKRSGLKVSHRPAYVQPEAAGASDPMAARLSAGDAIAKGLSGGAFALHALAVPTRTAEGTPLLSVAFEVDGPGLLTGAAGKKLSLEVYGYVLDPAGRIVDALGATPTLDLNRLESHLREGRLQILTVFRSPEGDADLRFLVRHAASGRTASLRMPVAQERVLGAWPVSTPLLMADPASRVVVPIASRAHPAPDLPFRVGQQAFSPEADPVLRNGKASEICVLSRPSELSSLDVRADLRGADGKLQPLETSGPMRVVKDPDGAFRVVLPVTPRGILPGDYVLRMALRDEAGAEALSEQKVEVRE
jgi:VWFA-related protein